MDGMINLSHLLLSVVTLLAKLDLKFANEILRPLEASFDPQTLLHLQTDTKCTRYIFLCVHQLNNESFYGMIIIKSSNMRKQQR